MGNSHKISACVFVVAVVCLMLVNSPSADEVKPANEEKDLRSRVAALEEIVNQLQRQVQDDKLALSLCGHWVEEMRVVAGIPEVQTDEVSWRLATNTSSDRYILGPEVSTYLYGRFSVDTSKEPTWIDFEVPRSGQTHTVKGIVRSSFGRCEISIPGNLFKRGTFLNPPRPTSFESTADNGYDVYTLIRERYKKTGVWQ